MRVCIAAVVSCLLVISAFAHPPQLYVGGAIQRIWTSEVEYPNSWGDVRPPWISYYGLALQVEGGWWGNFWNAYSAFRYDVGSHSWNSGTTNFWTAERMVIGARLRVSDHDPNPIKPVLGAGLSLGWAKRGNEDEHGPSTHTSYSRPGWGWVGEGGIGIRVQNPLMILVLLRVEDMGLQLERWDYGDRTRTVKQVSLSVGASYCLGATAAYRDK